MGACSDRHVIQLSLMILLAGASCTGVLAAEPAATSNSINMNDLAILENRFFSHTYTHDPAEKRLERIECLVYGSTREGSNPDRLGRLLKTVATRSQQPLQAEKAAPPPKEGTQQAAVAPPSSSKQYPILNTLEWKALKKTFPNETLDQRLDRLEGKMFGQPAQSMAYADRVERLKKTVGIGLMPEASDGITATGPKPKARPRGEESDFEGFGPAPQAQVPLDMNPFGGGLPSFGFGFGDTAFSGMEKQLQQMQQLFLQMQNPNNQIQIAPGNGGTVRSWSKSWKLDPSTGQMIEINPQPGNAPVIPGSPIGRQRILPQIESVPQESAPLREVPGYADPNSI